MEYDIFRTDRVTYLDDAGMGVDGYKVWFQWGKGQTDYAQIPFASYEPEFVDSKIVETIEKHNAVLNQE